MGKNRHGSGCDIWRPNTRGYGSGSPASALVPSPIWDVLAPQREREEAGERLWGDILLGILPIRDSFPIRQAVPVGLSAWFCSWARWAWFLMQKKRYYSSYHIFTYTVLFCKPLGWRERMDGIGWVWMSLSQLGRYSSMGLLGMSLDAGLVRFGFSQLKTCQLLVTMSLHTIRCFLRVGEDGNRWMATDVVG